MSSAIVRYAVARRRGPQRAQDMFGIRVVHDQGFALPQGGGFQVPDLDGLAPGGLLVFQCRERALQRAEGRYTDGELVAASLPFGPFNELDEVEDVGGLQAPALPQALRCALQSRRRTAGPATTVACGRSAGRCAWLRTRK